MQSIKFLSNKTIKLNGEIYKPYNVGNLPPSFGFKQKPNGDGDVKDGIYEWFNYKGLTYIKAEDKWYDAL